MFSLSKVLTFQGVDKSEVISEGIYNLVCEYGYTKTATIIRSLYEQGFINFELLEIFQGALSIEYFQDTLNPSANMFLHIHSKKGI